MRKKLVLSLIFAIFVLLFASNAYASISVKSITNSLGVEGYRRTSDVITINLTSSNESLTIEGIEGNPFECEKIGGLFYCLGTLEDEQIKSTVAYLITNGLGESVSASMKIDNSIGDITYDIANIEGNITLTYNILDTGFDGNSDCSKLITIEVYDSGNNINVFDVNSSSCTVSGSEVLSVTETGSKDFYIKAIDRVGNVKDSETKTIFVDVDAPEITNLQILFQGKELSTVSSTSEFNVDFVFDVFDSEIQNISVDLSEFHSNPAISPSYKNINVPLTDCKLNDTESEGAFYRCTVKNIKIKVSKNTLSAKFYAYDVYGNVGFASLDKTFTIDNTKPNAVQIVSGRVSLTGKSYVKDGLNKISIKVDKNNFETRRIYFKVGSNGPFRVINCSDSECFAYVPLKCDSGSEIEAFITTMNGDYSQDDAGNKMPSFSAKMYCDNTKPEFLNAVIFGNYKAGEASLIVSGSQLTIISEIADAYTDEITAYAYLDKLKNSSEKASCAKVSEGKFNCTWVVPNILEGYYTANIKMNFTDVAGNLAEKQQPVQVLGFKSDNMTPSSLNIVQGGGFPSSINRVALDLALLNGIQYPIYAKYTLTAKSSNVKVLYQEVEDCYYKGTDGKLDSAFNVFSDIKVHDPYLDIGKINRLDFTFDAIDVNALHDSFTIYCNISAIVQEGNDIYRKPQILVTESTFTLKNSKLGEPGQAFVDKIKETEKSVNTTEWQTINKIDDLLVKAQKICDMKQYIDMAQMGGVVIEMVGVGINVVAPGVGEGTKGVGSGIFGATKNLQSKLSDPPTAKSIWGMIGQACNFVSCNLGFNEDWMPDAGIQKGISDFAAKAPTGTKTIANDFTDSLTSSDLKNSIVMSTIKLCGPGVVYNLNKYRQINCEYLQCLKVYSAVGLDVANCEAMKSSKVCSIVVGETFELPFVRLGKNLFSNMADVVRSSYGRSFVYVLNLFSKLGNCETVKAGTPTDWQVVACHVPLSIQQYISQQKQSVKAQGFHYDDTVDYCDIAMCSGADCYTKNDLFGLSLPNPPTMTAEERKRANQIKDNAILKALDNLDKAYVYENVANYVFSSTNNGPRQEEKAVQEALDKSQQQLEQWKTFVDVYNADKTHTNSIPYYDESKYSSLEAYYNEIVKSRKLREEAAQTASMSPEDLNTYYTQASYTNYKLLYETKNMNVDDLAKYLENKNCKVDTNCNPQSILANRENDLKKANLPFTDEEFNKLIEADCGSDQNCINSWKGTRNAFDPLYLRVKLSEAEYKKAKRIADIKKLQQRTDLALRFIMDTLGVKKFLTADYWAEKFPNTFTTSITKVADAVDPNTWKNNLCNPDSGTFYSGADIGEGVVYQCTGTENEGCDVVLTFGAEKLSYNETHYMYTTVFLLGPTTKDVKYNVRFTTSDGQYKNGFILSKTLPKGETATKTTAFISKYDFKEMCLTFDQNFPPEDIAKGKNYYCRTIQNDIFNTGGVSTDETSYVGYSQTSSTSTNEERGFLE